MKPITPAEINSRNRVFWDARPDLLELQFGLESEQQGGDTGAPPLRPLRCVLPTTGGSADVGELGDVTRGQAFLKKHPITQKLERLGVSEAHFRDVRLGRCLDFPFDLWPLRAGELQPSARLFPLLRVYAALKWLILENPPPSRDRDDAWTYVAVMMAESDISLSRKTRRLQQERAKKPRGKTDDGATIRQITAKLIARADPDSSAKELWPRLYAALDELGLAPEEVVAPNDRAKMAYKYDAANGKRRRITFGRFATVVSEERRKKSR